MSEVIVLIIIVPLMAFIGAGFLGSAVLVICRDVLGIDNKVSEWLDRQFGTGWGLGRREQDSSLLKRLLYVGLAALFVFLGYLFIRQGVVEPIAEYVFGNDK